MLSNRKIGKSLNRLFCLVILIYFVMLPNTAISGENPPAEVVEAAVNGLDKFLDAIPSKDLRFYGFSAQQEIDQAKLGEPIRVYTITPDKVIDYEQGAVFISIISSTNLWLVPILSQGETKTLLTVDRMNGKWKAVAIGSAGLAKQLDKVEISWPSSDGYEHMLVRIFQAKSDFVVLTKGATVKIKPLESAILSLKLQKIVKGKRIDLYNPYEVMTKLMPVVHESIQFDNNMNE